MKRLAPLLLALLVAGGCGGEAEDDPSSSSSCAGGDIRILQGSSTKLPGGGEAGIGQVDDDADPPTVRLALGDADPGETADDLAVGDTFTLQGTSYEVTAICSGKVTLSQR